MFYELYFWLLPRRRGRAAHRVVAGHALPEPDHLLQAQERLELVLDLLARQVRVARRVQQRLLGRDQRPARAPGPLLENTYSFTSAGRSEVCGGPLHARRAHCNMLGLRSAPAPQALQRSTPADGPASRTGSRRDSRRAGRSKSGMPRTPRRPRGWTRPPGAARSQTPPGRPSAAPRARPHCPWTSPEPARAAGP